MTEPNSRPSAFRTWARTGHWPVDEPVETKFNPNHDELGRFTFANGGGGGYRDYAGTQTARWDTPLVRATARAQPQIIRNTRNVVNRLTGGKLTDKELDYLTDHVLNNIGMADAMSMGNIVPKVPLELNDGQIKIVKDLIDKLPKDKLGNEIRENFERAQKDGQVVKRTKKTN